MSFIRIHSNLSWLAGLFLILNLPVAVSPAIAEPVLMFGPQDVVRQQGPPVEQLFNFNMPIDRDGIVRVNTTDNTTITMNGVQIADNNSLNNGITDVPAQLLLGNNILGVTIKGNGSSHAIVEVFANNNAPAASFTAIPASGIVPLTVNFDASGSTDPDNDITNYDWDFGDTNTGTGVTTSNNYTTVNAFTATLTVTDIFGLTNQTTQLVDVLPVPDTLSGRIIDTNAFVADGSIVPVVGVTVSLLNSGVSNTSDILGNFTLSGVPLGDQILDLDTSTASPGPGGVTYAGFREKITLVAGANIITRDFYLPQIDPNGVQAYDPNDLNDTVVNNPNIGGPLYEGITMTIAAGSAMKDGMPFTGDLSISLVPASLPPAALPETLEPGLLITVQPVGVTFTTPAPITFPNTDNFPVGNEANLWSLDPSLGEFAIVGTGSVSPNGLSIDTVTGGIIAADWHMMLPPIVPAISITNNGFNEDKSMCTTCSGGTGQSGGEMSEGGMQESHTLAGYSSFGSSHNMTIGYNSTSANPDPIVNTSTMIPVLSAVPNSVSTTLSIDGVQQGNELFTSTAGLNENIDESIYRAMQVDASSMPTGRYPYSMKVTNNFPASRISSFQNGHVLVNNQKASPFGAGLNLEGLQRIHTQPDGNVVLTEGDGSIKFFEIVEAGQANGKFSPAVASSDLGLNLDLIGLKDLNLDGFDDYWHVLRSTKQIEVRLGDGQGDFLPPSIIDNENSGIPIEPRFVGAFNLNADNFPDLISTNIGNTISIHLADGLGGFNPPNFITVGNTPKAMSGQHLNGDSFLDLIINHSGSQDIYVFMGDGSGSFSNPTIIPAPGSLGSLIPADYDNDGDIDIMYNRSSTPNWVILFNDGSGNFGNSTPADFGASAVSFVNLGEFNNDGIPDFASNPPGQNEILIYLGDGTGVFTLTETLPFTNPEAIRIDDFNSNGNDDLAVDNGSGMTMLHGDGTGAFPTSEQIVSNSFQYELRVGDINGDGIKDFVARDINNIAKLSTAFGLTGSTSPLGDFSTLEQNPDNSFTRTLKDGTRIEFDANGMQTAVIDRNGNSTDFVYDAQDRLSTITDPANLVTTFAYDGVTGKLDTITDPAGRVTDFNINANGDLISITDPDSSTRVFGYDTSNRMTSSTSKRNFTTNFEYDFAGRLTKTLPPDGSTRQMATSRTVGLVDPASGAGTAVNPAPRALPSDAVGKLTDGNGNDTTFEMDNPFGAPTRIEDPLNRVTQITRDQNANPTQIIRPNGAIADITYDERGNLLTATEQSIGATTTLTYEPAFNQITSITDPEQNQTTLDYDANGNLTTITDDVGTVTALFYEDLNCPGLVTRVVSAQGLPEENTITNLYDTVTCNLVEITDPVGNKTTLQYDMAGNVISSTDALLRETRFVYDNNNRVIKTIDPTNSGLDPPCGTMGVTCVNYDAAGNPIDVIDANGHTTSFEYDTLGRTTKRIDPIGMEETFSYDNDGNLRFTTDRKLQTIELQYDIADQLTKKILLPGLPAEEVTDITYDVLGNILTMTDPDSALTFTYDPIGRLLTASTNGSPSQPDSTLTYTYDDNGNRLTMNDGGTVDTVYVYDTLNRLTSITNPALQATGFEYDVLSRRTKTNHHNGTVTDFAYDVASRLTSLSHSLGASPISSFTYTYNAVNNRDTLTTSRPTFATAQTNFNYGYDDLDRLTQATRPITGDPDETFTYDPVGNRLQRDGDIVDNTFDVANRLLEDANFTYTYDNNGNTTSKTDKATLEITEYSYDPENRLIGIIERINAGGTITKTVTYSYDANGRRIKKDVDGVITAYIYDGPDILFEYDGANIQQARYTHGPSVDEPLVMERGGQAYWYHADGLGSVMEMSDSVGTTVQAYLYDSYGNIIQTTGVLENPFTYTGRELDTESGLYFYRARYYDPTTGRFLKEDPIGFFGGNINLNSYVGNNPTNFTDPSGLIDLDLSLDLETLENLDDIADAIILFDIVSGPSGEAIIGITIKYCIKKSLIEQQRKKAVKKAWEKEKALIANGEKGTHDWTAAEEAELLKTGKVKDYVGHHINNVKHHPLLSGEQSNIKFVKSTDHLAVHGGNWHNKTTGPLIDR